VHTRAVLSKPFLVDRRYRSMEGPFAVQRFALVGPEVPELLWITGYRTDVVADDGHTPAPAEFMYHNNMNFDARGHGEAFGWRRNVRTNRMFTLSQGQFAVDLPAGFGIPVLSNERLTIETQVLNHNRDDVNVTVRHKTSVQFVRDAELAEPLRPLYPAGAFVMAVLDGEAAAFNVETPAGEQPHSSSCLPGIRPAHAEGPMMPTYTDRHGRRFIGHWVVKPGREERRTLATELLQIPFDTTIHFVAVHLHPFAVSLALRDLTTGTTLFESRARGPALGVGLTHVDHYASPEGIPVFKDHDYELVSVYDNTSGADQDAMASMFFYLHDREAEPLLVTLRRTLRAQGAARAPAG
jgi:hypothetical protein